MAMITKTTAPTATPLISVREFERKVLELEEVSITIRAASSEQVPDYTYARKAAATMSITDWVDNRIKPNLQGLEFAVINSEYIAETPHGRTKMETLRSSYER